MSKIKERLKDMRNEKGLTQKEMAKYLDISTTCYAGYEQGYREPNADMLIKIATMFNVTVDYLVGLEGDDGRKIENINTILDNRSYKLANIHNSKINIK